MKRIRSSHIFAKQQCKTRIKKFFSLLTRIALVLLLSVLLLEGVLWLLARVHSRSAGQNILELPYKGKITILCEGDAFTWGLGGKSYPTQLEAMLNARAGSDIFKVINTGVPDKSVGQSAREMPYFFSRYQPDVVILLSGGTQEYDWNFVVADPPKAFWRRLFSNSRVLSCLGQLADAWDVEWETLPVVGWFARRFGGKFRVASEQELADAIEKAADAGDFSRCLKLFKYNRRLASGELVANSAHKLARTIGYGDLEEYILALMRADLLHPSVIQNIVNSYRFKVSRIELAVILRAQYMCEQGIKKWPLSPEPYLCAAEVSARPGKYKLAESYAKKAIGLAPGSPNGYVLLSDIYALEGEYSKAESVIVSLSKANPALKRKIFEIQFQSGKYDLAARNAEKYLVANPKDGDTLRLLATIYLKQRKLQKVESSFKRLMTIYPGDPNVIFNLAATYAEMRRPVETRRYCQMAADAQPSNSEILFSCQTMLGDLGDTKTLRPARAQAARMPGPTSVRGEVWARTPEAVLQRDIRKSVLSIYEIVRRANALMILSVSPNRNITDADRFAAENGIPYLSVEELFSAKGGTDYYISFDNAHFNTEGYRILAEAYTDMLWVLLEDKISARLNSSARR